MAHGQGFAGRDDRRLPKPAVPPEFQERMGQGESQAAWGYADTVASDWAAVSGPAAAPGMSARQVSAPGPTVPQWQQNDPRQQWQQPQSQQPYRPAAQPQYQPPDSARLYPPPSAPQPPRASGKSRKGCAFLGCGGLAALVILAVVLASQSSPSSPTSAPPAASQPAAPAQPAASSAAPTVAKTVATFSGSGIQNTAPFTVTSTWRLDYSFDCSNFGQSGNFIVMEDGTLTGAMSVDELALTKTGSSYAYDDAGKHHIEVDSECSWTLKVIDEGS